MPSAQQSMMMTPAELACTRVFLGFSSLAHLADYLRIDQRRLQRMEKGEEAIPPYVVDEIDEMYEVANNLVNNLILQYRKKVKLASETGDEVTIVTEQDGPQAPSGRLYGSVKFLAGYETDVSGLVETQPDRGEEFLQVIETAVRVLSKLAEAQRSKNLNPGGKRYPSCWHRAVVARVASAVPGLVIEYVDPGDSDVD